MVTGKDIVNKAYYWDGKPYIFGYEVDLDDPAPRAADCSEMVQWTVHQCGLYIPDGAIYQYRYCRNHDRLISVSTAIRTAGALLFVIDGDHRHVGISVGNGKTIECRGKKYGCGQFDAYRFWTHGGLIPGVEYPKREG